MGNNHLYFCCVERNGTWLKIKYTLKWEKQYNKVYIGREGMYCWIENTEMGDSMESGKPSLSQT